MNNRDYKQFAPQNLYHIYNRGNGKHDIFLDAEDYRFIILRFNEYMSHGTTKAMGTIGTPTEVPMVPIASLAGAKKDRARRKTFAPNTFTLVAYCLMPNHFHFLMRQNTEIPLTSLMLNLWTGYAKYFNRKYDRVGSIFQDQFKAIRVDTDEYLTWLSAYIHHNPVAAGLCAQPEEYPYSSCQTYLTGAGDGLCDPSIVLEQFKNTDHYRTFLNESVEEIKQRKDLIKLLADDI